jgi:hypothetical protein
MASNSSLNFKLVDETSCNGNADYVWTKTAGARDSYRVSLASIPDHALITEIRVTPCASRHFGSKDPVDPTFVAFYRWNGALGQPTTFPWSLPDQLAPAPLPMPAQVIRMHREKLANSSLEIGVELVSDPKQRGMRLSRVAVTITYQEATGDSGGWGPGTGGDGLGL